MLRAALLQIAKIFFAFVSSIAFFCALEEVLVLYGLDSVDFVIVEGSLALFLSELDRQYGPLLACSYMPTRY